jgi:hypothetical protein
MKKQTFVVHAGTDTNGDIFFMEVSGSCWGPKEYLRYKALLELMPEYFSHLSHDPFIIKLSDYYTNS